MKKILLFLAILASNLSNAQTAKVDYEAFEKLVSEVKAHRQARLITLDVFQKMSAEKNVVILDTRSDAMYKAKHVKEAIHLNFSDFTQNNLAKLIPDKNTKILIYCNNNFDNDELFFPTKSYVPPTKKEKGYTLALNIPTYINLYGYGYKNVYELSELISVMNSKIQFEGSSIGK